MLESVNIKQKQILQPLDQKKLSSLYFAEGRFIT